MNPTPYRDLPQPARRMVDAMIEAFMNKNGHPPNMTREEMRRGTIRLIETGAATFVAHDDGSFSIKLVNPDFWK